MTTVQDYLGALEILRPHLWLVGTILLVCIWNYVLPSAKKLTPFIALSGLAIAAATYSQQFLMKGICLFGVSPDIGLYSADNLSIGFGMLACLVGFIVILMTMGMEHDFGSNVGEFYTLLLCAILAVMVLAGATDLILLFVALETLSLCCVLLSGAFKQDRKSNEAALKYLLSTAATTATLLYGFSFLYGLTSSTNYYEIHQKMAVISHSPSLIIVFMLLLILSAIGFKVSAVPFHMWTPDVYEGAPTPVSAFLSIGSKAGGFVVAIRLLSFVFGSSYLDWGLIVGVLAVLSMVMGNLIALAQSSLKRMLAYSSIAHVGYILIGLVAAPQLGLPAMMFYLLVYAFMNLGAFAGAILFANETGSDNINDFAGLIRKRPFLAIGLSICLLNLAGLPVPPAGFLAKLFIFNAGVQMQSTLGWFLVIAALITSVPAIYYYSRVVIKMVVRDPSEKVLAMPDEPQAQQDPQLFPRLALIACVVGIVLGSFSVNPIMSWSEKAVNPMTDAPALGSLPNNLQ